jgi:hypothetical protein
MYKGERMTKKREWVRVLVISALIGGGFKLLIMLIVALIEGRIV